MSIQVQFRTRCLTPSDIYEHLPFMHDTAVACGNPVIIELGVRRGNSTSAFLAAIEDCGGGGHLYSVDIEAPRVPDEWHLREEWSLYVGDDRSPHIHGDISLRAGRRCDVLFIDTSHEYEHTLQELDLYVPLVRPGGTVLMHDTDLAPLEVRRALDKWCPENNCTWTNRPGSCGLGVIRLDW